jgi:hypothetical protein
MVERTYYFEGSSILEHEAHGEHMPMTSQSNKKIVYVVGCGRSGTTLLGFALGNSDRTLDLGEVLDFVRFRGHPNGFGPETANYAFWDAVLRDVEKTLGGIDFGRVAELQSLVDSHKSFLPLAVLGDSFRRQAVSEYRLFISALYDRIQSEGSADVLIDSSKYPSRLLHLLKVYPDDRIRVIHLIRNPVELARVMEKSVQSKPRSFLEGMLYFFVINVFSRLVTRSLGPDRCLRLHYEDLVSQPEKTLKRIGDTFAVDTAPAVEKIRRSEPLRRGYVFNGNRMRMQDLVVFRKSSGVTPQRSYMERAFERLARLAFGSGTEARGSGAADA